MIGRNKGIFSELIDRHNIPLTAYLELKSWNRQFTMSLNRRIRHKFRVSRVCTTAFSQPKADNIGDLLDDFFQHNTPKSMKSKQSKVNSKKKARSEERAFFTK